MIWCDMTCQDHPRDKPTNRGVSRRHHWAHGNTAENCGTLKLLIRSRLICKSIHLNVYIKYVIFYIVISLLCVMLHDS